MGVKFGEIDSTQILRNEFRIGVLENLLQYIVNSNPSLNLPDREKVEEIRQKVAKDLQKKYPKSGIRYGE